MSPFRIHCGGTARALALTTLFALSGAQAADGLIATQSPHNAADTMNRFEKLVTDKGMTVFARINHAGGAKKIGADLRPTELLIFGNPQGGTPLMQCSQSFAIDLPLKALVWQDAQQQVWIGVNDLAVLARRHEAQACPAVAKVDAVVRGLVAEALKP